MQGGNYTWTNKQQYPSNIRIKAQPILHKLPTQQQGAKAYSFLQQINQKSQVGLVHFNDQTKQMTVYDRSYINTSDLWTYQGWKWVKHYSSVRNYFQYGMVLQHMSGQRGTQALVKATRRINNKTLYLSYSKTFNRRVDNDFTSNVDDITFGWKIKEGRLYDSLLVAVSRSSRQNQLSPYLQDKVVSFGGSKMESSRLKLSNMTSLMACYKYNWLILSGKTGYDIGNQSFFAKLGLTLRKQLNFGDVSLAMILDGAKMWGHNILKNDLLFRNKSSWPGSKSTNYISPRLQFRFNNYPWLDMVRVIPYLYVQGWGHVKQNNSVVLEGEYGIGFNAYKTKGWDLSLLRISANREGNVFGTVKFAF